MTPRATGIGWWAMAPLPSADLSRPAPEAAILLDLAEDAIVDGLRGRPLARPDTNELPPALRERRGVFVTLTVDGELNGCIGTIATDEPLAHAVARCARSAAFADPRLPRLRLADYEGLTIEVSVLSPLAPIPAASRQEVLDQLRPGVDGLQIAAGTRQGLFLPSVWAKLPDPSDFLDHLQRKAGVPPGTWPPGMRAWRFTAHKLSRRAGDGPDVVAGSAYDPRHG